jgi:hypothetical protein
MKGPVVLIGDRDRGANRELLAEFLAVHVHLRSGPIPPMGESLHVTSDSVNTYLEAA